MTVNEKALSPGSVLQGQHTYHIESVMGCGSFGITYKAYTLTETEVQLKGALGNLSSKREERIYVAIKEFFMSDFTERDSLSGAITGSGGDTLIAQYREKFKKEAECLSHLHHPNIVRVVEVFEANETVYYVMEFLEGGSLEQRINSSVALDERYALDLTLQIGSAIDYLHKHRLLHLDLKPGNVMLTDSGKAVLIDFGLSKQYDMNGAPESSTTIGGGTPGYSPIEQMSVRDFAPTLDIYALAATLFKCVTGQRPHEAALLLSEGFPEQLLTAAGVSPRTIDAIRSGMAPVPGKRPQDVCSLLTALGLDGGKVDKDNKALLKQEKKPAGKAQENQIGSLYAPSEGQKTAAKTIFSPTQPIPEVRGERPRTPQPPRPVREPSQPKPVPPQPQHPGEKSIEVDYTDMNKKKSKALPIAIGIIVGVIAFVAVLAFIGWMNDREDNKIKTDEIQPETFEATTYTVTDSTVVLKKEGAADQKFTYTGEVNANTKLPEGKGKAVYGQNGTVYEGDFKNGSCNGNATLRFANGDTFSGTVESDIIRKGRYTIKATGVYFDGTYDEQGNPEKGTWYDRNGNVLEQL